LTYKCALISYFLLKGWKYNS